MKTYSRIVMAMAALMVAVAPAAATTVVNGDSEDRTIAVSIGDTRSEVTIPAGQAAEIPCDPNCTISIVTESGDEGTIDAGSDDQFKIDGGQLQAAE